MRVLVTNTRNQQAYTIVLSLRPYAERIVVTTYGRNRLAAGLAPAARSRLVDARYRVPPPPVPWLCREPTDAEDRYVEALLAICRREAIDLIMPSRDEVVFILARHRERFAERGVAVPVCDLATLTRTMDKFEMLQAAERAGIPVPRTHLPRSRRELEEAIDDVGLPAVIKPRFGAGGIGLRWVMRDDQLEAAWPPPDGVRPDLLVQEYVAGRTPPSAHVADVVIDRAGTCCAMCVRSRWRSVLWHVGIPYVATKIAPHRTVRDQTTRLLTGLGWWGAANVDWKRDARDGKAKLLEVNARIGASVWAAAAAGVNVPLILARVALGQAPPPATRPVAGRVYLDPVLDALGTCTYLAHRIGWAVARRRPPLPDDIVPRFGPWLRDLAASYLSRRHQMSDCWRALAHDPIPPVLFWAEQAAYALRRWRDFVPHRPHRRGRISPRG